MPEESHQLAAIMFTDIVGYTSLMAQNQQKAMEMVERNRAVQKPIVEKHSGKWHKDLGDGSLISFQSAIEAVNCALEIQRTVKDDQDLNLRIGIHLGDVTFKDGDVYGDGVNVSSRIESIADPGGIYISESVQKAIRGRTDVKIEALGEFYLKHVDYPVQVFALQGEGLPEASGEQKENGASLWEELNKRNVIRAGLTYTIVALLAYYGVDRFVPGLNSVVVISILSIGFPLALFLAWRYERSPAGFVKTSSKQAVVNPYSAAQKKPLTGWGVLAVLSGLVIVLFVYPRFSSTTQASGDNISMAVVPFYNISADSSLNKIGLGMASSIATELSLSQGFEFISSDQATFRYANNREITPGQIGRELNVTHLLMGSFQMAGDQISVNVQMVDASGNRVWDYPARDEMENIFDLQSEISNEVLRYFSFKEGVEYRGTTSLDAYEHYIDAIELSARQRLYPNFLSSIIPVVIDHYEKAIELDSGYMNAWVGLVAAHSWLIWMNQTNQTANGNNLFTLEQRQQRLELVESYLEYMERFPDSWAKDAAKGIFAYHGKRNYDEGEKFLLRSLAENPNSYWANTLLGPIYWRKLDVKNGTRYYYKAAQLNNVNSQSWVQMGWGFIQNGNYEKAELAWEQAWRRESRGGLGYRSYLYNTGYANLPFDDEMKKALGNGFYWDKYYLNRDWVNLTAFLDTIPTRDPSDWGNLVWKLQAHLAMGNVDSSNYYARKYLDLPHENPELLGGIPLSHAVLGDRENAFMARDRIWEPRYADGQDIGGITIGILVEIELLCILGEYEEATSKLKELNENYPQLGDYLDFHVNPQYDKIKAEYPPFVEALKNLKLPPKLDEGVIDLM